MFTRIRLKRINKKLAATHKLIAQIRGIKHTSGYSKSEGDRRVSLLHVKLDKLITKERALLAKPPMTMGDFMCRWLCLWALIIIVIVSLAGCGPATPGTSKVAYADYEIIGVAGGNNVRMMRDHANSNVCYLFGSKSISCVPMRF